MDFFFLSPYKLHHIKVYDSIFTSKNLSWALAIKAEIQNLATTADAEMPDDRY